MMDFFTNLIMAGIGAFIGGDLRSILSDSLNTDYEHFRWGTIMANIIGSLLIGILWGMVTSNELGHTMNIMLITGFCGGLTTFSTFTLETLKYFKHSKKLEAWLYWIGSVILCLCCVYIGLWLHTKL